MQEPTPLRKWLIKHKQTTTGLARTLAVSRPRAQFWVSGATMPRGQMLHSLMRLTKLKIIDLIPSESMQELRRERELKRPRRRKPAKGKKKRR